MWDRFERRLLWDARRTVSTREELRDHYDRVSLHRRLERLGASPGRVAVGLPATFWASGLVLSIATGRAAAFLDNVFPVVFAVDLAVVLGTVFWLERRGIDVIYRIEHVFDTTEEEFYSFFGWMLERLYEPLPWAPRPPGRILHRPTAVAYLAGIGGFLVVPSLWHGSGLSVLVGTDWGCLPAVLQAYYVAVYLTVLAVGVLVGWVVSVGVVFMGRRVTRFDVRLDVTRKESNLGLEPYTRLVFAGAMAYLLELAVSSLFVVRAGNPFLVAGYVVMTLIPVAGLVGAHYGLYRAIRRSKRARMDEYREEFDDTLADWFLDGSFENGPPDRLEAFLAVKREVETLPDWPFNTRIVVRLLVAVVASNVSVVMQVVV